MSIAINLPEQAGYIDLSILPRSNDSSNNDNPITEDQQCIDASVT